MGKVRRHRRLPPLFDARDTFTDLRSDADVCTVDTAAHALHDLAGRIEHLTAGQRAGWPAGRYATTRAAPPMMAATMAANPLLARNGS